MTDKKQRGSFHDIMARQVAPQLEMFEEYLKDARKVGEPDSIIKYGNAIASLKCQAVIAAAQAQAAAMAFMVRHASEQKTQATASDDAAGKELEEMRRRHIKEQNEG